MTVSEAIRRIDLQKQNTGTRQEKLNWLSELDGLVKAKILDTHGAAAAVQLPYEDPVAETLELLVPPPYDGMYLWWLEAKIDYQNGEFVRFNNAMELFCALYRDYADDYHRQHSAGSGSFF